ncbi:MAG: nuclear transport factor 2 family protein [Aggregatilineales bacterium]
MIDQKFANQFADEWIAAWNSHNMGDILSHYEDDFEFASPLISKVVGEPSGRLKGKAAIGAYWSKALSQRPNLHFELLTIFMGVNSLVLHYQNQEGRHSAEAFEFGAGGKVIRSFANYAIERKGN